ncbi:hypothetical protein TNCV_1926641 [Trichonephila clavipes]|nr:hypothetical protein TNCV_1926641 [Trichonephila clavipes]
MLGRRIAARPRPPATVRDLEIALLEEWNSIPQSLIDNLIASMANREKKRQNCVWVCVIGNVIEEVVDLTGQINLEVDRDDAQELLDFQNRELSTDELIEIQEQDIEELASLDGIQSEGWNDG